MPILRGAVTFSRFQVQVSDKKRDAKWLAKHLSAHAFEPINRKSDEERAAGFVELEDHDSVEFSASSLHRGEYALFGYRIDTLKVPGNILRAELEKWCKKFELEKGHSPKRHEKNEGKAVIREMLRSKATSSTKVHDLCWNLSTNQLQIWAASRTAIDEVTAALEKACNIQLKARVPTAVAESLGISEDTLAPTAQLRPNFDEEVCNE